MWIKQKIKKLYYIVLRIIKGGVHAFGYASIGDYTVICKPMRVIGKKYIHLGNNDYIMNNLRIEVWDSWGVKKNFSPTVRIENNVSIQQNCHITCANKIVIGSGTSVLPEVLITDIDHIKEVGKSVNDTGIRAGEVIIGNNCVIGMGARILSNGKRITIGNDCVIGANAVVTSCIPDGSIAVGIPARVIKKIPV